MADLDFHCDWRDPHAGGLSRLIAAVEAQRASRSSRTMPRVAVAATALGVFFALGIVHYARIAPQRDIENAIRAAITDAQQVQVDRGAALEMPSSRSDVRIVFIARLSAAPPDHS